MRSLAESTGRAGRLHGLRFLVVLRSSWSLLVGIALMMLGHGLQGTLLGVRATLEGFPTAVTGIVMSGYYAGLLVGSFATPPLVARVGHVRVFGALVGLASTSILFQALFVVPWVWFLGRLLTGLCFAGAFICAESWLNGAADNENRGRVLAVYMVIQLAAYAGGQFLLDLADPRGVSLFITVAVLISVASVPMLLTATHAPAIRTPRPVGLGELYRASPLGVVGIVGVGFSQSALYAIGPVYAQGEGLSLPAISTFMAIFVLGGVLLQWPLARLSDRLDRRQVIAGITLIASLVALGSLWLNNPPTAVLFAQFFVIGGLVLPMYAVCAAHTNDFLEPQQMVGASSAILVAYGLGAALGPTLVSLVMTGMGPIGFLAFIAAVHGIIGAFALFRMTRRPTVPVDARSPVAALASTPTALVSKLVDEGRSLPGP